MVGRLEKGAMITPVRDEKGWTAIEAPTNAYAFVAAELVEIQAAPAPVVAAATAPAPEPVVHTSACCCASRSDSRTRKY